MTRSFFGALRITSSSLEDKLLNSGLFIFSIKAFDWSITNFVKLLISLTASLVIFFIFSICSFFSFSISFKSSVLVESLSFLICSIATCFTCSTVLFRISLTLLKTGTVIF